MVFGKVFRVITILAILISAIPIAGCHQQEPEQEFDTITLFNGRSDVRFFDLSKDQTLNVQFIIYPKDAEIVAIIGSVAWTEDTWEWCYRYKEWAHIKHDSAIEFKAPSTYSYAIWFKPRLDQTVTVTILYWFSD